MKYIRRNFLCGLQGREPNGLNDLNAQLRAWVWEVANRRVHGTTHEPVAARWDVDHSNLYAGFRRGTAGGQTDLAGADYV